MVVSLLGLRGMILCQELHDCTSEATRQVREVGGRIKDRYGHPNMYRGASITIFHSLETEFQPKQENEPTKCYAKVLGSEVLGFGP